MNISALSSTLAPTLPASAGGAPSALRASMPSATPTATPSALAAARFRAVMGAAPDAVTAGAGAAQSGEGAPPGEAAAGVDRGASPLGDRILQGLGVRVAEVSQRWHDLADRTRVMSGSSDPTSYMQAQMDLLNLSVSAELVSKVSGRMVQNIDALVKNP